MLTVQRLTLTLLLGCTSLACGQDEAGLPLDLRGSPALGHDPGRRVEPPTDLRRLARALELQGYEVLDVKRLDASGQPWSDEVYARVANGDIRLTYRQFPDAASAAMAIYGHVSYPMAVVTQDTSLVTMPPQHSFVRGARLIQVFWEPGTQLTPQARRALASLVGAPDQPVTLELVLGDVDCPASLRLSVRELGPEHDLVDWVTVLLNELEHPGGRVVARGRFGVAEIDYSDDHVLQLRIQAPTPAAAAAGPESGMRGALERSGAGGE